MFNNILSQCLTIFRPLNKTSIYEIWNHSVIFPRAKWASACFFSTNKIREISLVDQNRGSFMMLLCGPLKRDPSPPIFHNGWCRCTVQKCLCQQHVQPCHTCIFICAYVRPCVASVCMNHVLHTHHIELLRFRHVCTTHDFKFFFQLSTMHARVLYFNLIFPMHPWDDICARIRCKMVQENMPTIFRQFFNYLFEATLQSHILVRGV